jgi:hypothetical protein
MRGKIGRIKDDGVEGRSWRCRVKITLSIFKVDGPGNVVTILMPKGLASASTSDTFVTKPKNDSF